VCWPLDPTESRVDSVGRIGAVGYELLVGSAPPADGGVGRPSEDTDTALWQTIDAALTGSIQSAYELKRALLFGPAEPLTATSSEPTTPTQPASSGGSLPEQISRRTAVGVLGAGVLGLTGFFARDGGGTTNSNAESESEKPPEATFQGRTTVRVTHDGGDEIKAGRLSLRNTRVSGTGAYEWPDYEGYDESTTVSEGDSIVIDRGVLSMWYVDVVWTSPDGETVKVLEERQISEEQLYAGEEQR
jgi:hypothetical protein